MAKKISGVAWISERGGSGVLTQAMQILKERNVNFKASDHHVFFSQPTTNLVKAETLARDVGLSFSRSTHKTNKLNPNELIGGLNVAGDFVGIYQRFRADEDYSAVNMGVDMAKSTGGSWQAITTVSASSAAVTAAMGLGGTAVALPAAIAVASAMAGTGHALFKAWLPQRYRSLVSKL
ncbi:MAG: hypothetical protein WCY88_09625 [Spongiibacteraceae bacterium]